ncbi:MULTISPECIES: DUF2584 domain-containing protein [Geobacillus]|uniref:Uncharacterized protein n=1 Tax=Geobacillus thermocatenulatus TaxID=33938 RepID=A0A226QCY9_9BACL|nr:MULTISPECIES: DUF2584 domain-containing protein [Geobacillus]ASS98475.1 hypothetical protein GT3921_05155 [Geobacillus thermocatenulatus]KLR74180.1 hypothetical protein ABH20_07290 [Geobacillus sp. T6]KPC98637.1 hypothetical protein LR69_03189 [Geobacillus sp. BCO2]OXB89229.1 hypothetical protein B9L19_03885 [Geobacillus thermocatenulatus]
MGMPMELQTVIVTKGNEQRIQGNTFVLKKDGYRLYPLDVPLEVRRTLQSEASGIAVVKKLEWEDSRTTVTYELVSLYSTN